jgi:glycosyltransferase involved in cell wall biosynthesis
VAALVTQELGIDVQVIRPPVPAEIDRRQWDTGWVAGVVGETRYVVHAGQLGPAKGTDLVLTAADGHLRADPDFHLHLCGRDAGAQPHINRLRRAYGDRVHYHGRLGRERLHPLMEQAVALMCPSRADNLPNVAIEAMSLGVPVVGVRGASIDELVVDGQSGFLAPVGDAGGLAAALSAAWLLPDGERQAMGARARTQVLQMLDEQKCCRDLEDLYSRAAQSQLPPRRPRHEVALHVRADLAAVSRLSQDRPASDRSWRQMMRSVASGVGLLR